MLILARKEKETIEIGEGIRITVVEINGNRVRLGIEAPRNMRVDRSEVRDRIRAKGSKAREHRRCGRKTLEECSMLEPENNQLPKCFSYACLESLAGKGLNGRDANPQAAVTHGNFSD